MRPLTTVPLSIALYGAFLVVSAAALLTTLHFALSSDGGADWQDGWTPPPETLPMPLDGAEAGPLRFPTEMAPAELRRALWEAGRPSAPVLPAR